MTSFLPGKVVGRRILASHQSRLLSASLVAEEGELDRDLQHSTQLCSASEGLELALARTYRHPRAAAVP